MNITEKAAYLKGLCEGLGIDQTTKEGKLLNAIIDVIDDMALTIADLDDEVEQVIGHVDEIDEDLAELESDFYDEDDDEEDEFYEIKCPSCGETIYVDEEAVENEEIECPGCGEKIELEFDECCCDEDEDKE